MRGGGKQGIYCETLSMRACAGWSKDNWGVSAREKAGRSKCGTSRRRSESAQARSQRRLLGQATADCQRVSVVGGGTSCQAVRRRGMVMQETDERQVEGVQEGDGKEVISASFLQLPGSNPRLGLP